MSDAELSIRGIKHKSELVVPIKYKGIKVDAELRCDLFVENILPVELKATEEFHPIHEAQIMTYMKLFKVPEGLLLNFNVTNLFKEGKRTYVNELYRNLKE